MYICDENVLANELDFKKALDLLNFLENPDERESRRLRIWAKAILRDAWTQFDMDNVLQSISGTIFFKIIEFALGTGKKRKKKREKYFKAISQLAPSLTMCYLRRGRFGRFTT